MTRLLRSALVLALAAAPLVASAQDASVVPDDAPDWLSMEDAVVAAGAGGKLLLVYGYAPWCGYCVRFDQNVFTDDAVQAYLADHYAPVRLNLESTEVVQFFDAAVTEAELGQAMAIRGTPTAVFVGPEGELITKFPGYTDPETFGLVLRYVREEAYETATFQEFLDLNRGG